MQFLETQFPSDISYGSSGGPEYLTDIVISQNGYEQRNINWDQARARYNVAHGVKTSEQLDALIAFFRTCKGRARGFRFKDWNDFEASNEFIATADGSTNIFQLIKTYETGGNNEVRFIKKPVAGSVVVYVDSVEQTTGVSVNAQTGEISFVLAPDDGAEIRADFEFDVPVRFDTDTLSASLDAYGAHSWQDIPLIEIRV